ncbi:hypothetical protein PRIPAC_70490 [Pristionchus pacificus]|uniref:Uncharacterized protein n=1 Tax=Pristionchus pacificus TaxID=54126 RepID=A0A2A6CSN8_PRIPA|nr:hypothetical protein PRIPAC_70490 [Pristionchus pacificus]|eukprot:PDM81130.1 hypothetical protein PRIPAC_36133 [Pristionchus pacificus]
MGYQPVPQGGYPPPQQGYPPPQQGYPSPQQGYPPPQQGGYPPPQQGGYPPPQQGGYPPPPPPGGNPGPNRCVMGLLIGFGFSWLAVLMKDGRCSGSVWINVLCSFLLPYLGGLIHGWW